MEYIDFINDICNRVQEELGADYEVVHDCVIKNNSKSMDTLVIRTSNDNIAPSIYLNKYYDSFILGKDITDIVTEVVEFYMCNRIQKENVVHVIEKIRNFDEIKSKIIVRMINADMNEIIKEKCPTVDYLDFLLTFHYLLDVETHNDASIRITNELFDSWGIELDKLLEIAMDNTISLLPAKVEPISKIIKELVEPDLLYDFDDINDNVPMLLVATNKDSNYGAVSILYNGMLSNIADKLDSDLVIIPSSVHEVLILALEDEEELPKYLQMVEEVNDTQLETTDILSYNVYVYSKENMNIKIYPADFL